MFLNLKSAAIAFIAIVGFHGTASAIASDLCCQQAEVAANGFYTGNLIYSYPIAACNATRTNCAAAKCGKLQTAVAQSFCSNNTGACLTDKVKGVCIVGGLKRAACTNGTFLADNDPFRKTLCKVIIGIPSIMTPVKGNDKGLTPKPPELPMVD